MNASREHNEFLAQEFYEGGYPKDWPKCPKCGDPAMDGHITCGKLECDELFERRARGMPETGKIS
jgi:hypothetical protein